MGRTNLRMKIFAALAAAVSSTPVITIINGQDVDSIEDAPHQISMRPSNGSHMCGGSIATNKHVITAAHCYYNPQRLIVVAGNKNRNLVKIFPHKYKSQIQKHTGIKIIFRDKNFKHLNSSDILSTIQMTLTSILPH